LLKTKIRGVYSTALTKLLLDNGFEIVQLSPTIKQRFSLSENQSPPDLKIKDRYDLQGVRVLGTSNAVTALQSLLHSAFVDALTRKWRASVDGIYKGNIVDADAETLYVEIDNEVTGKLPKSEVSNTNAKQIVVQVERKRMGWKHPVLTTKLKIVGNYAILVQNSKVGVSFNIRDLDKRAELYALGREFAPGGWGIIWRESSANQPREVLESEITSLKAKAELLNEKAANAVAPALLIEGLCFMDVELPSISKSNLDKLRASVVPTLDKHHFYKSCGGKVSAVLEMAEKLLEKGQDRREVEEVFRRQVMGEFPEVGSVVDVEHVKLSGRVFHLGQATIESVENEQTRYSRTIRSDGFYDGLGCRKETGDKAISETKTGQWWITTKYFSESEKLKGAYINLNTPVEVYPKAIRYVDLEVDVCIQPEGAVMVLDMEKLEKALEKGFISEALFGTVKEKVKEITRNESATRIS